MEKVKSIEHRRNLEILKRVDMQRYSEIPYCPFCGEQAPGENFNRDTCSADESTFPQLEIPVFCDNCGKKWVEIYTFNRLKEF
jgi:hypothetical protein